MVWHTTSNTNPTPTVPSCLEYVLLTASGMVSERMAQGKFSPKLVTQYIATDEYAAVELAIGADPDAFVHAFDAVCRDRPFFFTTFNWTDDTVNFRAKCASEALRQPSFYREKARVEADLFTAFRQVCHAETYAFTEAERASYYAHTRTRCVKFYVDSEHSGDESVLQWRRRFESSPSLTLLQRFAASTEGPRRLDLHTPITRAHTSAPIPIPPSRFTHEPRPSTMASIAPYTQPPPHTPQTRYTPVSHVQPTLPPPPPPQELPSMVSRSYVVTNLEEWARKADIRNGMPVGARVVLTVWNTPDKVLPDGAPDTFTLSGIRFKRDT
jgi:hypothetical protein